MGNPYRIAPTSTPRDVEEARERGRHTGECDEGRLIEHGKTSYRYTCDGFLGGYDTYQCPCWCHTPGRTTSEQLPRKG